MSNGSLISHIDVAMALTGHEPPPYEAPPENGQVSIGLDVMARAAKKKEEPEPKPAPRPTMVFNF